MARTIKELSAVCGVSEQAIRKWCARNQVAKDVSQHYVIDETIESLILGHYRVKVAKHSETSCETSFATNETMDSVLEILKEQLKEKDKQIERLQNALDDTQKNLTQEQQLHALTKQQYALLEDSNKKKKKHWWSKKSQ